MIRKCKPGFRDDAALRAPPHPSSRNETRPDPEFTPELGDASPSPLSGLNAQVATALAPIQGNPSMSKSESAFKAAVAAALAFVANALKTQTLEYSQRQILQKLGMQ